MEKHFTYTYNDGTVYEDCYFHVDRYRDNNNLCVILMSENVGVLVKITANPNIVLSDDCLAIKDYSENKGIVEWLISLDMIKYYPLLHAFYGTTIIPVYELTDNGKEILDLV